MKNNFETLVTSIYDCAADPALWPRALSDVREAAAAAHVAVGFKGASGAQHWHRCDHAWEENWLGQLTALSPKIPRGDELFSLPVDVSWTQLAQLPEDELRKSQFYDEWLKPQNLRDFLALHYLKREDVTGMLTIPTAADREPVSRHNRNLAERLSPHIRRAMVINDMTEQSNLATAVYRQVLDRISAAVFVVGSGRKLLFTNTEGERLLSAGDKISMMAGQLHSAVHASVLDDAVDRALRSDEVLNQTDVCVPLFGADGEKAVACVLPLIGNHMRSVLGPGHCAIIVGGRGKHHPMAMEMLRDMFDLTAAEARIAVMISSGNGPQLISHALGIKVNTVRTHLKHIFAKSETTDQTSLAGLVNEILPPVT
jgi:DNA-binding CsgD family transcriptional regulator